MTDQPAPYTPATAFSPFNPSAFPNLGVKLDTELGNISTSIDETQDRLAEIQRNDGALANDSVGPDQLQNSVFAGINTPETWATATAYVVKDSVYFITATYSKWYKCLVAHTSGVFATDLAAGYWELVLNTDIQAVDDSEAAAAASAAAAAADVVLTHADVVLTHADVVLTHADVVLTHADVTAAAGQVTLAAAQVTLATAEAVAAEAALTSIQAITAGGGLYSRFLFTATEGQTSVSGADDSGATLSYSVGQEIVFVNGALQTRVTDYAATTGTSITGMNALRAGNLVTVWSLVPFTVANIGTAGLKNTGTSGANVPLLDGANTWSAAQTFGAVTGTTITASTGFVGSLSTLTNTSAGVTTSPISLINNSATASTALSMLFQPSNSASRAGSLTYSNNGSNRIDAKIALSNGGSPENTLVVQGDGVVTIGRASQRNLIVTDTGAGNPKIAVSAGSMDLGSPVVFTGQTVGTTIGAAGGASALPATPLGYITTSINGVACKIPYYNT